MKGERALTLVLKQRAHTQMRIGIKSVGLKEISVTAMKLKEFALGCRGEDEEVSQHFNDVINLTCDCILRIPLIDRRTIHLKR